VVEPVQPRVPALECEQLSVGADLGDLGDLGQPLALAARQQQPPTLTDAGVGRRG
jgi:hypothetical protein